MHLKFDKLFVCEQNDFPQKRKVSYKAPRDKPFKKEVKHSVPLCSHRKEEAALRTKGIVANRAKNIICPSRSLLKNDAENGNWKQRKGKVRNSNGDSPSALPNQNQGTGFVSEIDCENIADDHSNSCKTISIARKAFAPGDRNLGTRVERSNNRQNNQIWGARGPHFGVQSGHRTEACIGDYSKMINTFYTTRRRSGVTSDVDDLRHGFSGEQNFNICKVPRTDCENTFRGSLKSHGPENCLGNEDSRWTVPYNADSLEQQTMMPCEETLRKAFSDVLPPNDVSDAMEAVFKKFPKLLDGIPPFSHVLSVSVATALYIHFIRAVRVSSAQDCAITTPSPKNYSSTAIVNHLSLPESHLRHTDDHMDQSSHSTLPKKQSECID